MNEFLCPEHQSVVGDQCRDNEQKAPPIPVSLKAELEAQGMIVQEDGFIVAPNYISTIASSRKLSYSPSDYASNTTNNGSWALLSMSRNTDPFTPVPDGTSTAPILNQILDLVADGEGVDLVCQDGDISVAVQDHPEWLSAKYGTSRFQAINWPVVTGTTGTYTQPANYYTTRNTGNHGTCSLSTAGGKLYGFAKEAALYSIGAHSGAGLWTMHQGIDLVRLFHIGKADKTRPTVLMVNLSIGILLSSPNGAAVPAYVNNVPITLDLSTSGGRTAAQQNYNVPIFTGTETYLNADNTDVRNSINNAIAAGVIVIHSEGNWRQRGVDSSHPAYGDYFVNGGTNIYFNRSVCSSTPDAVTVGAITSNYTSNKEYLIDFTTRGPLIDVFAPGAAVPAATINSSGTGTVLYPGSSTHYTTMFGGTSSAGPLVAGLVAAMAQLRPWMTSQDAKSLVKGLAITDRLYVSSTQTLNDPKAFVGADNRFSHIPVTPVSA